jgi:hypothetical protein
MFNELDRVVLEEDFPADGLKAGDIGTIVMVHQGGKGFEVEFVALDGETVGVITAHANQLRPVRPGEIAQVRSVEYPIAA